MIEIIVYGFRRKVLQRIVVDHPVTDDEAWALVTVPCDYIVTQATETNHAICPAYPVR